MEWLIEQGLVLPVTAGNRATGILESHQARTELTTFARDLQGRMEGMPEDRLIDLMPLAIAGLTRANAIELREFGGLNALPVLDADAWHGLVNTATTNVDVVNLVLKNVPIPGNDTALDDVLMFRNDARSEGFIHELREWMNEVGANAMPHDELSDKLEVLMRRYRRGLEAESRRRNTGVLETVIVSTAEIAESLVKFQWSKLAKKLFEVKHRQIDLTKAEMTLPGREVAYIVKARERFGG